MRRHSSLLALAIALCAFHAAALAAETKGFKTDRDFKPGTEQTLKIKSDAECQPSGYPGNFLQPLGQKPQWLAKPDLYQGALQLNYNLNLVDAPKVMVLDIKSTETECFKKNPSPLMFMAHRDDIRIRILLDLNGNEQFEPAEIQETQFKQPRPIPGYNPGYPMYGPYGQSPVAEAKFPMPALTLPDGKPFELSVQLFLQQHYGMHMEEASMPVEQRFMQVFQVMPRYSPCLSATLETGGGPVQVLLNPVLGTDGVLRILRYSVAGTNVRMYTDGMRYPGYNPGYNPGQPEVLDRPFQSADGRWWMIAEIAPDWSTVTVVQPGDWLKDASVDVGTELPGWTRPDLISRRLVSSTDLRGQPYVLSFAQNVNYQSKYLVQEETARKLRDTVGRPVRIIFIDENMQMENFVQQTLGREELPYTLVPNQDFIGQQGEQTSLASILKIAQGASSTIVVGADGKVLMRDTEPLPASLGKVVETLKTAPSAAAPDRKRDTRKPR